ncbi:MAG: threonine/serine dehydratase [Bacteroidia bacterium]
MLHLPPTLEAIAEAHAWLRTRVLTTPVQPWHSPEKDRLLGQETGVWIKLELLQHGGSFKARGALRVMAELDEPQRARGVTAVSAGNHAIAVAYAARSMGTIATVVMPRTANPFRVQRCEALGAKVVLAEDVQAAFEEVERIREREGRYFVHPFEGPLTALGTATVAWEYLQQVPDIDAYIIPIGGGGLAAGMAAAIKQHSPHCAVFGVEPMGADSMSRSLAAGQPVRIGQVQTIADSLGAPFALPYSYALCSQYLDEVVRVDDDALVQAMRLSFTEFKLAVEPAGAASLAALLGPLRERLRGRRVGLIACGANIDPARFFQCLGS